MAERPALRVLISGAGIAGSTLAYWLAHDGGTPTLVEKAPALRRGGYLIDFWGAGFDVADRMSLRPELFNKGYAVQKVIEVDRGGRACSGCSPSHGSPTWWPAGASGTASYCRTIP